MKRIVCSVIILITLGSVAACSSGDSSDAGSGESSTTTSQPEGTVITEQGPVEMNVGETATIELEANQSTGYQWELVAQPDEAVVTVVSDTYVAPDGAAPGTPGHQRVVIEGIGVGTATIALQYVRPWETDVAPVDTATYDITVS